MSELAFPDSINPSYQARLHQRCNGAFAKLSAKQLAKAFAMAQRQSRVYALLGSGIKLFTVPANRVKQENISRTDYRGESTGDYDLWLNVAASDIRYDQDALQSGILGAVAGNRLIEPRYALNRNKVDLCNVFFAIAGGMPDLQDLPVLQRLNEELIAKNLKAYVAATAQLPIDGTVQPYCSEVVLAVTTLDKPEVGLFNRSSARLMISNWGRDDGPRPKAVAPNSPPALQLTGGMPANPA